MPGVSVPHAAIPVRPGQVKKRMSNSSGYRCVRLIDQHAPPK